MNNERYNQIIHEVYENYLNYPLATIHDHRTNILYKNMSKGWCMLNGRSIASPHPTRHLTKEEFINKIKTDDEFAKEWGLKIEKSELSWEDKYMNNERYNQIIHDAHNNYIIGTWCNSDTKWVKEVDGMNMRTGEKCKVYKQFHKEEFINKCKTDPEFSERWGLKIEERELNVIERMEYYGKQYMKEDESMSIDELHKVDYEGLNIPTKLITVTYKDEKIEVYE